ncbi:MAG: aldo/keto reductase [Planctomycetota bacterium]|jgi:predicted aldo/keto reductase-like oxidoreductase
MEDERLTRRQFMTEAAAGAAGIAVGLGVTARAAKSRKSKILNYHPDMDYRRLGKTELMMSAVCMGGHWKRVDKVLAATGKTFERNCHDVVSRCIEVGINYIDACCIPEVCAYSKALAGRRDKMYLALSGGEVRNENYRTAGKLMERLDSLLKKSNQEYTDLWRITCLEPGGRHSFNTSCEIVEALERAKKQGKARFGGFSTHDRRWIKFMIEYFPQIDVVVFPYTAKSKAMPRHSLFDALKKCDVGAFGIKPFASNSLFKGSSAPDDPHDFVQSADNTDSRPGQHPTGGKRGQSG